MNKKLLTALKRIKKQAERHREGKRTQEWFRKHWGICSNVGELVEKDSPILRRTFQTWGHFSGDENYPVPSLTAGIKAEGAYHIGADHDAWIGDYGDLRMDLLRHCIKTLEAGT